MTVPQAIVVGALIVGASVLGSRLLAPYHLSAAAAVGGASYVWRLHALTGEVVECKPDYSGQIERAKAAGYSEHATDGYTSPRNP